MKKTLIVLFAIVALIGSAGFETVIAQDGGVAAYLVMIVNQGTQITNQLTALTRMTAHIDQLTGQFEHLKESALGQIGAITDPIADLVAVPTDLLNTTRDWHSDFTGQAGSLVTAHRSVRAGATCCKRRTPSPRPIFGTSTRAAPIERWPSFSAGATTPIAALSWHMHAPMPQRRWPQPPPKHKTRSTP